jgi:hypothetical protein
MSAIHIFSGLGIAFTATAGFYAAMTSICESLTSSQIDYATFGRTMARVSQIFLLKCSMNFFFSSRSFYLFIYFFQMQLLLPHAHSTTSGTKVLAKWSLPLELTQ